MFNEKADGWKDVNGCFGMKNDVLFEDGRLWTMSLVDTNDSGRIRLHPSSLSLTNDWNTPETSSQPNCRSSPKLSCDVGHEEYSSSKDHHSIPVACGRRGGGLETSSICQNYPTHRHTGGALHATMPAGAPTLNRPIGNALLAIFLVGNGHPKLHGLKNCFSFLLLNLKWHIDGFA